MDTNDLKKIMLRNEEKMNEYATKNVDAVRLDDEEDDIRPAFFHDIDRIIYSLSYTRYMKKTQVFSFNNNDHLSKRIVHVQFVSKIARTLARALSLNEDLTEAIALGHDIGHTPIGHVGEKILNEISEKETGKMFNHNIQSVKNYMYIERNGRGSNLTVQTLDGIMCHNGELLSNRYEPMPKTTEKFLEEYNSSYTNKKVLRELRPMTLEGCIVRISDIIAYVGRDIEDAINIGLIGVEDIPKEIREILGTSNREIINTIILDIINNSIGKKYIQMSENVYKALLKLKKFNYINIYDKANSREQIEYYRNGMWSVYKKSLLELEQGNINSDIYKVFVSKMSDDYLSKFSNKEIVIDYIAGMTDEYFLKLVKDNLK